MGNYLWNDSLCITFPSLGIPVETGDKFHLETCSVTSKKKKEKHVLTTKISCTFSSDYVNVKNADMRHEPHKSISLLFGKTQTKQSQSRGSKKSNAVDLVKLSLFHPEQAATFFKFCISTDDEYFLYKNERMDYVHHLAKSSCNHVSSVYYGKMGFIKVTPKRPITEKESIEIRSYLRNDGTTHCPLVLNDCRIETWINYVKIQEHDDIHQAFSEIHKIHESIAIRFDVKMSKDLSTKKVDQVTDSSHYRKKWKLVHGLELCLQIMTDFTEHLEQFTPNKAPIPNVTENPLQNSSNPLKLEHPFKNIKNLQSLIETSRNYLKELLQFKKIIYKELKKWYQKQGKDDVYTQVDATFFIEQYQEIATSVKNLNLQLVDKVPVLFVTTTDQIQTLNSIQEPVICYDKTTLDRLKIFNGPKNPRFIVYDPEHLSRHFPSNELSFKDEMALFYKQELHFIGLIHVTPQSTVHSTSDELLQMPCPLHQQNTRHWFCEECGGPIYSTKTGPRTVICKTCETTGYLSECMVNCFHKTHDSERFISLQQTSAAISCNNHVKKEQIISPQKPPPINGHLKPQTKYSQNIAQAFESQNGLIETADSKQLELHKFQYNVLIMGQSGVGKSTLLNAIKNYLVYPSAKQALDAEFEYMIATKFDVYDEDTYEPVTVCIGNEDNEVFRGEHEAGSRTQSCKEHRMTYTPPGKESMTINFIDTPGLTDTRGGDQDVINLKKIYTKLRSDVKELHAICLVLKPNESVLTRSLETAILELLSIFPNEAMPNLVFFMTYAHGTFFRPGDTMTPLDAMRENLRESRGLDLPKLSKDTFYCVDNETFRYLCARHQNIPYTREGLEDYLYSWQESRAAVMRFMDWLRKKKVEPFNTRNLISSRLTE